jgi:hypothetical protein
MEQVDTGFVRALGRSTLLLFIASACLIVGVLHSH